jgi:prepilin-type N-terminal cleavage/methylation domain-containing protein
MKKGFTLIELLVVISIIGILLALSVFGLQGARLASRDAKRKSDLELIRSGLEIYKADCDSYPATLLQGGTLIGDGTGSCLTDNTYITLVPSDPLTTSQYVYAATSVNSGPYAKYTLCATLEQAPSPAMDVSGCGNCITACNYKVTNP